MLYNLKRLTGYALGFVLFYAPVALFQRCLFYLLYGSWQPQSIHGLCFRIPIEHVLDGIIWRLTPISMLSTLLLLAAAFFLGPVFCGRLCPAGAFTEYLSKLVPSKFQISWIVIQKLPPSVMVCWQAFALCPFRWHSGMLLLQFLFVRFIGQLLYTRLLYFADIQSAADSNYVGARLWYLHKRWSRLLQFFVPGRCCAGIDACHRLQAAVCTAHACRQKPMHRLWLMRKEMPYGIR